MTVPTFWRWAAAGLCALVAVAVTDTSSPRAENVEIATRRAAERKTFSDAEIAEGFFKIAFGAELGLGGRVDRIRKYDVPVRIYIDNQGKPDRRKALADVVRDIRSRIAHLDLSVTGQRLEANVIVRLVRDHDLARTVRRVYGAKGNQIVHSLEPQCLSGFRKDDDYRIISSDVIIVVDAGEFVFYDCAYEEMLQALGPIRDDSSVPWTMFNDDVQMGFFDIYDQYLLNILYDPRIRAGMTREQVRAVLPEVIRSVRTFVAGVNGLPE